jgi:EAL domain-containing protein (putative c-di-GMP-specific phosphodiesterase class I)
MSVVAEGVETQEDWDAVRAAGVDIVQGYFVAKPMAAAQARVWLSHRVKAS